MPSCGKCSKQLFKSFQYHVILLLFSKIKTNLWPFNKQTFILLIITPTIFSIRNQYYFSQKNSYIIVNNAHFHRFNYLHNNHDVQTQTNVHLRPSNVWEKRVWIIYQSALFFHISMIEIEYDFTSRVLMERSSILRKRT